MGGSLFDKRITELHKKNASLEREFHTEIEKAVDSFSKDTEIDTSNVFFYQNSSEVNVNELTAIKGVMSFEWGIIAEHENDSIEVRCPVNVVKKKYINAPDEVVFSIGSYDPDAEALSKPDFMKSLVNELLSQISLNL